MSLNKPSGNMYPWAYTWNPLGGECRHKCSYCYREPLKDQYQAINNKYSGLPRVVEREMIKLYSVPDGYKIFVCSMTDLFASNVPYDSIRVILRHCCKYPNPYLFQSKNPIRFYDFIDEFPQNTILGTTIETNREELIDSQAPYPRERYEAMKELPFPKMISLEPLMDFDVDILSQWIVEIQPEFVSVGADSKSCDLSEPIVKKIAELVQILEDRTQVKCKKNLERISGIERQVYDG